MKSVSEIDQEWRAKLLKLTKSAWRDAHITGPKVDSWLKNFDARSEPVDMEHHHALHLLQNLMYFGNDEMRETHRAALRDQVLYPIAQELLKTHGKNGAYLPPGKHQMLESVRFIGVGRPSESGQGLLYDFRAVNEISVDLFVQAHELINDPIPSDAGITHIIYFDDFCGTGQQVRERLKTEVKMLRSHFGACEVKIWYLLLFASKMGRDNTISSGLFDEVKCVILFDDDYRAFCDESWCYKDAPHTISKTTGKKIMETYGTHLDSSRALGYKGCELLVAFHHNTPDNTLPVFWFNNDPSKWHAIFPRSDKI